MLQRLRHPDESVYVWIDAICINQKMLREKEAQLGMMDNVYSTTEEVIVYLGEEADDSHLVEDFASRVLKALTALQDSQPNVKIENGQLAAFGLPGIKDPGWKALGAVFGRARGSPSPNGQR